VFPSRLGLRTPRNIKARSALKGWVGGMLDSTHHEGRRARVHYGNTASCCRLAG